MTFEVELTEKADRDLRNIFLYIAFDLSAPENAERQINRLWDAILSLDELPERYRRYEDEPWHSRGMRVLPIDNFVILYIPYLEEKVVRIIAVMYGGRDIGEQLKKI
ncbi:MAG TPA: type II toxin-antitoxin system RelE/ParE family toxin [Candidatus Mediterraneibacter faecavium]|uniref:Type II toxin-antitoxin system RelE/ParE family toxin n=1 Tax=Candidatus Mediterraneibacter faecavium TaxID=2838668 RepID=A0A9D2QBB1_9FIRM|nr:type II toxin-antitoxin system RelE/ParE family toxin [Candidatus Mediterraneibacter faecavium]